MSQKKAISNPAFQSSSNLAPSSGFNLIPKVNNFNAIFDTKPLDGKESRNLEKLLFDFFLPGRVSEDQVSNDLEQLKNLTSEIKAITRQGILLIGERIHSAREILKPYRDGAFGQWIDITFGSRRTAYNMLSYYQLYTALPDYALKERFKMLPSKAAYLLASKDADIEEKAKIIENYSESSTDDLIMLIQDRFPSDITDGRKKTANRSLLDSIEQGLKKIARRKDHLTQENLEQIARFRSIINEILSDQKLHIETSASVMNPEGCFVSPN